MRGARKLREDDLAYARGRTAKIVRPVVSDGAGRF